MRSSTPAARTQSAGFTLLEVLAAVALLGIVFTFLARSASFGVLSEGDSRRRFEASLLADSQLADLERSARGGEVVPLGVTETEFEDFTVVIESLPWSLPELLQEERDLASDTPSLVFGDGSNANPGTVREVHLSVTWSDGVDERSIERVTYAVDLSAVNNGGAAGEFNLLEMNRQVQEALDAAEAR